MFIGGMEVLEEDLPADLVDSEAVCLAEVAADAPGNESGGVCHFCRCFPDCYTFSNFALKT